MKPKIGAKRDADLPSLESLLQWAKSISAYIEIYGDGSAEVQMGDDFSYRVSEATLRNAIIKAQVYYARYRRFIERPPAHLRRAELARQRKATRTK